MTEHQLLGNTAELVEVIRKKLNESHTQQFNFSLESHEVEVVQLRTRVTDDSPDVYVRPLKGVDAKDLPNFVTPEIKEIIFEGKPLKADVWDRITISHPGRIIQGPAIITEMDSNTLILPDHYGEIDNVGNILIWPSEKPQVDNHRKSKHSPESADLKIARDPLIATMISSSLQSIRREMDTLMLRCAMSPAIREQQDEFNVISNPRGQMLVGQFGSFIPSFLDMWKGTIEEGDVFM